MLTSSPEPQLYWGYGNKTKLACTSALTWSTWKTCQHGSAMPISKLVEFSIFVWNLNMTNSIWFCCTLCGRRWMQLTTLLKSWPWASGCLKVAENIWIKHLNQDVKETPFNNNLVLCKHLVITHPLISCMSLKKASSLNSTSLTSTRRSSPQFFSLYMQDYHQR